MRKADPSSVVPMETKADYRRLARNMLRQLEQDVKRELGDHEILELSGAAGVFDIGSADWTRDKYGITKRDVFSEFYKGLASSLHADETISWLADELEEINRGLRGTKTEEACPCEGRPQVREARRKTVRRTSVHSVRHEPVSDPFYIIQGLYNDSYGAGSSFGYDDEETAINEAKKLSRSPYFEGDYVRIITRDGDLVWDSRNVKRTRYATSETPEARRRSYPRFTSTHRR